MELPPQSVVGPVALAVASLARSVEFYERVLGLRAHRRDAASAALGAGGEDLLVIEEHPDAPRPRGTTGLFHFALLLPSRPDLAKELRHLAATRYPLPGFADHLVSESIYLADPEGNGIELYRDRPRNEWTYQDGQIRMATDPLDVEGLLAEIEEDDEVWDGLPAGTVMGHVHLRVADLAVAEAFYHEVVGFDLTTHFGRSAAFLSTGGYHHHAGLNTWESLGAPAPPPGSLGLQHVSIRLPAAEIHRLRAAAEERRIPTEDAESGLLLRDPSGNGLVVSAAADATAPSAQL